MYSLLFNDDQTRHWGACHKVSQKGEKGSILNPACLINVIGKTEVLTSEELPLSKVCYGRLFVH